MSSRCQPVSATHFPVRDEWLSQTSEEILEPDLPIIDPHHHIWDRPNWRYMIDDIAQDLASGHNIIATVFVQCHSMHRANGPEEMAPVGETEFVNGVAAIGASGLYGKQRLCAGIVGHANLTLGKAVKPIFMNKIINDSRIIFATIHRRENWGTNLNQFSFAIKNIINFHKDIFLIMPMHPNKVVRQALKDYLEGHPRIILVEPLPYQELVYILRESYLVITDSGGLQEEAPTFGKPVLVFRETTEREELIFLGNSKLIGTSSESLEKYANELLTNKYIYEKMSRAKNPFGDGYSAERIFDICSSRI